VADRTVLIVVRRAVAIVRDGEVVAVSGDVGVMNAASLVKPVIAEVALQVIDDLDERVDGDITVRHVLTHTTGLPNWRPEGEALVARRPPGVRWGYSGEGFALLMQHLERRTGRSLDSLVAEHVFVPLGMRDSGLDDPEPGYHGYRQLLTTASDYARFLSQVLAGDASRWDDRWPIDGELAWGSGWGIELGPRLCVWQWGSNEHAKNFVIGCPETGAGVVVLTDDPSGRDFYRSVVERELPGDHPSLRVEHSTTWQSLFRE
jgi:CubicO group peptidase (beta-lactamase class C family)